MSIQQRLRILLTGHPTEASREVIRDHLFACVAIEDGGIVTPATGRELLEAGLGGEEALELALASLRRGSRPEDLQHVDTLPGLRFMKVEDGLAASRLMLLPELFDPMPLGGLVVAVPEPQQLLCVPMDSATAIDGLQALASAVGHLEATREHLLSDQLFWFDGTRWGPIPVHHGDDDITVLPPPDFLRMMSRLASMDWVQVAGEA